MLPIRDIHRGDVIVFKYPEKPDRDFIKRVIGLPGETVEIREKKVYINGQPLEQADYHLKFKPRTEMCGSTRRRSTGGRRRSRPATSS